MLLALIALLSVSKRSLNRKINKSNVIQCAASATTNKEAREWSYRGTPSSTCNVTHASYIFLYNSTLQSYNTTYLRCMAQHPDFYRRTNRPCRRSRAAWRFSLWSANYRAVLTCRRPGHRPPLHDWPGVACAPCAIWSPVWCRAQYKISPSICQYKCQPLARA